MADQPGQHTDGVGKRVQMVRKLRGLTQDQLATRAHLSVSLIKKVETGSKAATPYFVATVARALRMSVPELYGQPAPRYGAERAGVPDLETAVMAGSLIASDGSAYELDDLAARNRGLTAAAISASYDRVVSELPVLLADINTAVMANDGDDKRRAYRILAETYRHALICLHRFGSDVTAHAADLGIRAAEQGEDPVLASVITSQKCLPLLQRVDYANADYLCHEARLRLGDEEHDTVESRSALGYSYLCGAEIAGLAGDVSTADGRLNRARHFAEQVPADANAHGTVFNLDNVSVFSVAVAVNAGNGPEALRRRTPLGPGLTAGRRAHHHVDLARAHLLIGEREDTLAELDTARRTAPQLTRYHPDVHETIRVLAASDRRRTDSLSEFARWAGIAV